MRFLAIFKFVAFFSIAVTHSSGSAHAQSADIPLGPNETVRVKVYEWRASEAQLIEWPGLSGEFQISAAGRLFMPLIGELLAEGASPGELAVVIEEALKDKAGLAVRPTATVEVARFRPIYVLGEVERPDEYEFRPGMTVLNALSIAGGMARTRDESTWSPSRDAIHANGEVKGLDFALKVMLARRARLEAEMSGADSIAFPAELTESIDARLAEGIMHQETEILKARKNALEAQTQALEEHKDLLEQEIESLLEQSVIKAQQQASLEQEVANIRSLVEKGYAAQPRELSLQREVADFQADQIEIKTLVLRARQDLTKSDLRILEIHDRHANEVATELQETLAEIEEMSNKRKTAQEIIFGAAEAASIPGLGELEALFPPVYTIVHADGTQTEATENSKLKPGDVVKVEIGMLVEQMQVGSDADSQPRSAEVLARQ